jgi:hypothetical protein
MTMMMMMGHEYIWGTLWRRTSRIGEEERKLRGHEDGSTLHIHL